MSKIGKKLLILTIIISIIPVIAIVTKNRYEGPVKFVTSSISAKQDFAYSPKEIVVTVQASDVDTKQVAEKTVIRLQNSKSELGYPMAAYEINGGTINFRVPILEPGYYMLDYSKG